MVHRFFRILLATAVTAAWPSAHAQQLGAGAPPTTVPAAVPDNQPRSLELSVGSQNLSAGYGNWQDLTLRGVYGVGAHVLQGEFSEKRQFGRSGTFFGLGDTVTINPDWFASLSFGFGDGAFYLPRFRADAFLNRKLLAKRNLVASVGVGYYDAPDGHVDRSLSLGGAYYFEQPWVLQAGVRFNRSNPGSISTHQQFIAVTYGREKSDLVTARYGWGGESYQTISQNSRLVDFQSREGSLAWRHWLDSRWGVLLGAETYRNPSYERNGLRVGVFHQF